MTQTIYDKIEEADLILIGLGEELNLPSGPEMKKTYSAMKERIKEENLDWMLPSVISVCAAGEEDRTYKGLCKLAELLRNKNYFVVSVSVNDKIADVPWKEGRLVRPCGGGRQKQCSNGCEDVLKEVALSERELMEDYLTNRKMQYTFDSLGACPVCGQPMVLNNVYTEKYNEQGYLEQWKIYTKWLQGTLHKKLLILELGVGMQFPSVVRWPFEKIAFFQKKAEFYRINEKLYHLSEELKEKGIAIAKNAIDWLEFL